MNNRSIFVLVCTSIFMAGCQHHEHGCSFPIMGTSIHENSALFGHSFAGNFAMICVDKNTGDLQWRQEMDNPPESLVWSPDGNILVERNGNLVTLDGQTGEQIKQERTMLFPAFITRDRMIVIESGDNAVFSSRSCPDGQLLWTHSFPQEEFHTDIVITEKLIFLMNIPRSLQFNGTDYQVLTDVCTLYCVDRKTGQILWHETADLGFDSRGLLECAEIPGGYVACATDRSIRLINAEDGSIIQRTSTDRDIRTLAAWETEKLVMTLAERSMVSDSTTVRILECQSLATLRQFKVEGRYHGDNQIVDDTLILIGDRPRGLNLDTGEFRWEGEYGYHIVDGKAYFIHDLSTPEKAGCEFGVLDVKTGIETVLYRE